ncbi:hypothetical protein HYPSUDRAFT_64911 [Hypholoma sublateritium FD-334 SS-4]|uniref:F-box domain-containing protein n=1 Tax=Hypholoma sublateritium (strain FD-334 SS-4) TaxID=945553 RepID=A0A0D2MN18_HYPSF|nr:hypothetical protein HYPSUDRAFT_64911 [Hypholoma sublateritium FD-334 SS-4]
MGVATLQTAPVFRLSKELLVSVFMFVYYASSADLDYAHPSKLTDPALFPACLARVCRHWKKVVRSVPLFATRVIVRVDIPVVLSELKAELAASKSLLVDVFVIRREYPLAPMDAGDSEEREAVQKAMDAVALHVARLRVLVFDVLYAAALPRVTDLAGAAPKLRTFRVKCRYPDAQPRGAGGGWPMQVSTPRALTCPTLQYLDMYGPVFLAALQIPRWITSMEKISAKQLCISHLYLTPAFDLLSLLGNLSRLGHLTKLRLAGLSLDPAIRPVQGKAPELYVQNIELEDLSREAVVAFGAQYDNKIDLSSLALTRCELSPMPMQAWRLSLEDIAADEDICAFVRAWDGYSLCIDNCAGADDVLIDMLAERGPYGRFNVPTLRELHLSGRDAAPLSVSPWALMCLVNERNKEADKWRLNLDPRAPLSMHTIVVNNAGCLLEPRQKEWFEARLEVFIWGVVAALRSPVLVGDCSTWDFSEFDDGGFTALALPPPSSFGKDGGQLPGDVEDSRVFLPPLESGESSELLGMDSRVLLPPPESQDGQMLGTQESDVTLIEPTGDLLDELCDPEVESCVLPPTQESNTSSCMGPDESLSSSQFSIEDGGNCRLELLFSQVRHPV